MCLFLLSKLIVQVLYSMFQHFFLLFQFKVFLGLVTPLFQLFLLFMRQLFFHFLQLFKWFLQFLLIFLILLLQCSQINRFIMHSHLATSLLLLMTTIIINNISNVLPITKPIFTQPFQQQQFFQCIPAPLFFTCLYQFPVQFLLDSIIFKILFQFIWLFTETVHTYCSVLYVYQLDSRCYFSFAAVAMHFH